MRTTSKPTISTITATQSTTTATEMAKTRIPLDIFIVIVVAGCCMLTFIIMGCCIYIFARRKSVREPSQSISDDDEKSSYAPEFNPAWHFPRHSFRLQSSVPKTRHTDILALQNKMLELPPDYSTVIRESRRAGIREMFGNWVIPPDNSTGRRHGYYEPSPDYEYDYRSGATSEKRPEYLYRNASYMDDSQFS
ncbi:uncharacterized protein LOC117326341 [Pecten maximus]|uniref:uncharacterized protein LOC117326341 n=1 Tax=Pecten maximus TaxID=6579 RepID=UPI001458C14B|nr:uncharacterized protein LOC117326341 [Pecten maximus]